MHLSFRNFEGARMNNVPQCFEQLAALAAHLAANRRAILRAWRAAVDRDPQLTTASTISRAQFNDHIPDVLDAFQRQLCAHTPAEHAQAQVDEKESAAGHGLHRWQQGYDQRETMCEWGHLHLVLLEEIERFGAQHGQLESSVLPTARRMLVQLCNGGICESAGRYARMQRSEAAGRLRDLEQALEALQTLERERAEAWREAAHDLRGSVSVISSATKVLDLPDVPDPTRAHFSRVLRKGVASLHELLADLMSLARLEAGHEQRQISEFDAARLLKDLCETLRPLAAERALFLRTEGPESLLVEGDAAKIQRIVQNLVLNAFKVTERGGVRILWHEAGTPGREQWVLCVQDTGPGLNPGGAAPLARALRQATADAQEVETRAERAGDPSAQPEAAPTLASQSPQHAMRASSGEGIGLSIVKRMSELLDASVELESAAGEGTTFRLVFPRHYSSS
jgi:signal transduction histidine kinase